jgi:hypothetical protein
MGSSDWFLKADALEIVWAGGCATKLVFRAFDPEKPWRDQPPISVDYPRISG